MDANLWSFDRVYEPWPLPVVAEVMEPSDGDGVGVRVFQGVTTRTDPSRTERLCPGNTVIRHVLGAPFRMAARSAQGPVHFPPAWRVIMGRCHPGQPGQGRRARAEWNAQMGDGDGGGGGREAGRTAG